MLATIIVICLLAVVVLLRHEQLRRAVPVIDTPPLRRERLRELEIEILGAPPDIAVPDLAGAPEEFRATTAGGYESTVTAHGSPSNQDVSLLGAVVAGVAPGGGYAWEWAHVDHHLFQAIGQLTHESIHSVVDLGRVMQDHGYSASSLSGPSLHLVNKIKGHVAEWIVADHADRAGHPVHWPPHSNQPGWDLQIGDKYVNVKDYADAHTALTHHFTHHPDIAVVLPGDAMHLPEHATHFDPTHPIDITSLTHNHVVLVDDALLHHHVASATKDGLDVGSGDVGWHFPWVVAAMSSYREANLLWKGDTDLLRSAKNIALDTTLVGGGGAVGAKLGAAVGTAVTPVIGTVVGALIGGVSGALLGRKHSNALKRAPLREAQGALETARQQLVDVSREASQKAQALWDEHYYREHCEMKQQGEIAKKTITTEIATSSGALARARRIDGEEAAALLEPVLKEIASATADAFRQYKAHPLWRRIAWPSRAVFLDKRRLRAHRQFYCLWKAEYSRVLAAVKKGEDVTTRAADLMASTTTGEQRLRERVRVVGITRAAVVAGWEQALAKTLNELAKQREAAMKRLLEARQKIFDWLKWQLSPLRVELNRRRQTLIVECRKAGVSVPKELETLQDDGLMEPNALSPAGS